MLRLSSARLAPIVGATCRKLVPQPTQFRNIWEFPHAADFRSVVRELDRQMERFETGLFERFPLRKIVPRSIPIEGNAAVPYRVNIDVTGFKPDEIHVGLKDNVLTVRAKMERTAEDGSKFQQEVSREISVPDKIVLSELKSYLSHDGVLTIEAPFESAEKPKEIPVNRESSG